MDWNKLLDPDVSVLEIFLRGSAVYLFLFVLLRLSLRREAGAASIGDLLVIVLIADAAQNAMASSYESLTDGFLLVSTLVFWTYTLDWFGYTFPKFGKFVHPEALQLVRDGQLLRRNMRRELITDDELLSQLRLQDIDDVKQVKAAFMEGDGRISVLSNGSPEGQQQSTALKHTFG